MTEEEIEVRDQGGGEQDDAENADGEGGGVA